MLRLEGWWVIRKEKAGQFWRVGSWGRTGEMKESRGMLEMYDVWGCLVVKGDYFLDLG